MPIQPIKIDTFGGAVPAIDNRLLPNSAAAEAVNTWLFSGRIEPVHALVPIHTMRDQNARSFFRLPKISPGIDYMSSSWWLEFTDPEVRVIRSPIAAQDDDGRYYWADGQYPKMMTGTMIMQSNATLRGVWSAATNYIENDGVTVGAVSYTALIPNINQPPATSPTYWVVTPEPLRLGVPAPEIAPAVSATGGVSTTNKTVNYVYTWVTALGEEGPPSPPGGTTNKIDATYHIAMTAPTPSDKDHRQLTKTRLYRTVVGAQGVATYFFVIELPIATLAYDDNCAITTDAVVVGNDQLTTLYWTAPPDDLQGLVTMPNGIVVGWRHNEVWFSEPYYPHAWPVTYIIAVDPEIVMLGVVDQSLMILTDGQPYSATGVDPQSMALRKIQPLEPCTSRLSVVNTQNGVLYASPNGLINITPSGAANLTSKMLTKDQWNMVIHLNSLAGALLSSGYYGYSLGAPAVFQADSFQFFKSHGGLAGPPPDPTADTPQAFQDLSEFGSMSGIYISTDDARIAFSQLLPLPSVVDNVITDIFNGEVTVLRQGVVYLVDLRKLLPYAAYRWRSKIFTLPYLQNLGAAKVYWTPPYVPIPPPITPTVFRVFASDHATALRSGLPLRFEEVLTKSGQIFRLPSGYKALYYQFEVEGLAVIDSIHVAQTAHELRAM